MTSEAALLFARKPRHRSIERYVGDSWVSLSRLSGISWPIDQIYWVSNATEGKGAQR